ncbi:sensor histidine kinase [Allohahella marinimesophila]
MALAWLAHGLLLDRMAREFVEARLKEEVAFLEHQIRDSDGKLDTLQTGDYFQEVFHHAFAIHSLSQTIISPEPWAPLLMPLIEYGQDGTLRVHNSETPNAPLEILAYRTSFRINEMPIVVIVSEDLGALKQSQAELHAWTAIVSILLVTLLVVVIWFGISLSLSPVVTIKSALRRLQDGEISRIEVQAPDEFRPLVQQLNQLLNALEQRLERSRIALANLSHSVKSPIAAVRQILADSDRELTSDLRNHMRARLDDIDRHLEAEIRRSRFAGPQVGKSAYPVKQARDLLWMLGRLYPEKSFELASSLPDESRWLVEEHDLNEIMGNLIDNAGKWSTQWVELSLEQGGGVMRIRVTDDGPGVDEQELGNLGQRGLRLDEQTPGHGLGLAIVRDMVARYGGRTSFSKEPKGGLRVTVELPEKLSGSSADSQ